MDLLGTRQVDPIHQSPRTRAYGFFAKGTVPTSHILILANYRLLNVLRLDGFCRAMRGPGFRASACRQHRPGLSSIFHLECDVRGRERTIVVTVIGDERQSTRN